MTAKDIRQKYIDFFKSKGHMHIASAPLIPENDPTVLFTTAGMHPLVPFLMGEAHPAGKRLVSFQKCIRTGDIDEVGDATHHTFFEMLGNWSLGDYFKKEAIEWSFEFLTSKQWLGIDISRLAISVFKGDNDAPRDEESADVWKALGIPEKRIAYLGKKDNWWGPAGKTGPCGPDTEMFFYTGKGSTPEEFHPENNLWVEIWNDVFMQYNKTAQGTYEPLVQKNVDTGMGLERMTAIMQGKKSAYETELFLPIIKKINEQMPTQGGYEKEIRIIADHVRAATFILGDQYGVSPSNVGQGYVLRKLVRRAIRMANKIGITKNLLADLAKIVVNIHGDSYPELSEKQKYIYTELTKEEEKFQKTLENGLQELKKVVHKKLNTKPKMAVLTNTAQRESDVYTNLINAQEAFYIFSTYGFPFEMIQEEIEDLSDGQCSISEKDFQKELKKHQEISRQGTNQKFAGGLADHTEETKRLHTATHLLHQALRIVLGSHVEQKGSNITKERLRFDFSHTQPMTKEEKQEVENIVNEQIQTALPVTCEEMTRDEARAIGAIGLFGERYGAKVKVYSIGNFSKEICGGPHVENTKELKNFSIKKEESSSAGVRRIKATVGN